MNLSRREYGENQAAQLLAQMFAGDRQSVADLYDLCVDRGRHETYTAPGLPPRVRSIRQPVIVRSRSVEQQSADRRRAARVLIDGRLVAVGQEHGRVNTYNYWSCRCLECSAVVRAERLRRSVGAPECAA